MSRHLALGKGGSELLCLRTFGCSVTTYWLIRGRGVPYRGSAPEAFVVQRRGAHVRGIAWEFTLPSWWRVWQASGKWSERGCGRGQYVMARHGDIGPYSPNNVYIATVEQNALDHQKNSRLVEKRTARNR